MKISDKTRPAKAGRNYGETVIENIHLFYLDDNALEYLQALTKILDKEFKRRKKEFKMKLALKGKK